MSLKKNIFSVLSANILTIISGIIVSFIVPIVLSVESYAHFKTYTFYVSYILILSLGFADGIYYRYGGREEVNIDKQVLKNEHRFYLQSQLFFTAILLFLGFIINSFMLIILAISIIPINMSWFYKFYYQAVGNFKEYSKATYVYTLTYLIINVFFVFILRSTNYKLYCVAMILAHTLVFIIFEIKFRKKYIKVNSYFDKEVLQNIKVGFFILMGNLSTMLFYALDRWFIKIFMNVNDFAYYSFAISMMNLINTLISSISITFYNYLAKNKDIKKIIKLKRYFLMIGSLASGGYFVFSAIISTVLKKYEPSLNIIAISFAAYPYMIIINSLYVNLYKTDKNEKKYMRIVINMVVISVFYNVIAIIVSLRPENIAIATLISFITWYIYSSKDFKFLNISFSEVTYLSIVTISFILATHLLNWLIGGIMYLIIVLVTIRIIYKNEFSEITNIFYKKIKNIKSMIL